MVVWQWRPFARGRLLTEHGVMLLDVLTVGCSERHDRVSGRKEGNIYIIYLAKYRHNMMVLTIQYENI